MRCWRYGMPSSARPSRYPIRCAKSAFAARCRSRPSQKHRNDAALLRRNQPRHDKLATQAWLALTAPITKLGACKSAIAAPPARQEHDRSMSYIEASDTSLRKTGQIKLHGPSGFAGMRKAGALVAKCLDELTDIVKPGAPTSRIDDFVREFAFSRGAYPATLMYRGYRYSTCTSINHVVCHGMPGDRLLKEGDIVNIDVTFIVEGWYGDSSRMYAVGPVARKAERLIEVTYEAMMRGIGAVKPGATTGDIGHAIQGFVEPQGMSVVRDFCGHGLGRMFHDEPNIIHIGRPGEGVTLKPGMFFTI